MAERNPWEIDSPSDTISRPLRNPWEVETSQAPAAPQRPSLNPWEEADLSVARSEENTLFGRGKAQTAIGEFGAGLQRGFRQLASTPHALAALGLEGFDYLTGYDNEALTRDLMQTSLNIAEGGAQRGVAQWEDLTADPMSWLKYASGTTGESIPFLISIMAGGGAPGLLAKLMARKGISSATRAGLLASMPAQIAGATATGTAIETGATAQELFQGTGEVRPGASVLAGTAKGALESVFPMMLSRQLGLTGGMGVELAQRLFTRAGAKQLAQGIAAEAGTEYLQEEIDLITRSYLDEKYGFLSPEANSRRINALLAGGTGGGIIQTGVQLAAGRDPAGPAPEWEDIAKAAQDTPIVIGQGLQELPVSGPDEILRTAPVGGLATVTAANALEQQMLLSEDPISARGLYAPYVEGSEPQFGTQEDAVNDHGLLGGQGYLWLDPTQVRRGDVTVAVQDLPDTAADPRIDYLDSATAQAAQAALVQAIKVKGQAAKARSGLRREELLQQAQLAYRQAIDLGVRVEPLSDSQVILRDPKKVNTVAKRTEKVISQVSEAGLKETRSLPNGKKFYVFERGTGEVGPGKKGRRIDLEKLRPDDVTALPDANLARRVLGTHEVSRKLSLGRARGMGIRFTGRLRDPVKAQNALKLFVRFLQGISTTLPFERLPAPMADRFMMLVDLGLRLDVTPGNDKFAVLDQVGEGVFPPDTDVTESTVRMQGDLARIVRQRTNRGREGRVSPNLQFESDTVAAAFFGQFHNNEGQKILAGKVEVGPAPVRLPGGPLTEYTMQRSPLAQLLRSVVKALGLKTDYTIEIVGPNSLGDRGVAYTEKSILLPGGKSSEPRSVIQIDPWYYARPTAGGKPLIKPPNKYVIKGGPVLMFGGNSVNDMKRRVIFGGQETSLGEVLTKQPLKKGQWPLLRFDADISKPGVFVGGVDPNKVLEIFPDAKPINNPLAEDVVQYRLRSDAPVPAYTPQLSSVGEKAKALGTGGTKLWLDDKLAEMYADVSVAFSESIVKFEWDRTENSMQEALRDAWRREMHLAQGTLAEKQLAKVLPHPLLDRALGKRTRQSNQFEFEEWLVMQTARWLTHGSPQGRITALEKFFKRIGDRLKKALTGFWQKVEQQIKPYSLDPNMGQPHETVLRWIDQMQLRGIDSLHPAESFLQEGTRNQLLASIQRNQAKFKELGIDEYVVAAPERASSRQVRELLKIFPKDDPKGKARLEALIGLSDRYSTLMDWTLGLHQMSDMNPHIKGLRDYVSLNRAMENAALSWATLADGRLRDAQKLGKVQLNALTGLLIDLDQMTYLDPKKLADGSQAARWPTVQELDVLVKKHKLTKGAFDVYVEMRNDFLQFLSYLEEVSVQQVRDTISDPKELAEKIAAIQGQTAQFKSRPYFPHMRFGQYTLTVKGPKNATLHFEAFPTKKARDDGAKVLEVRYEKERREGKVFIREDEMSEVTQQYQGLPGYALNNVIRALGLDQDNALLTPQQRKDKAMLETMAVAALPTESFRKHLAGRNNVPGFSSDALRSYANYFGRSARFMARMEFGKRMEDSIRNVRATGSELTHDKRTRLADFMQNHFETQMQPAADWAEVRALGFMWYFAFAPASALVNFTQVPMVSMPFLASKFGDLKTMGRITAAYAQATKELFSWLRGTAPVEDTVKNEALEEAHFSRLIDDGYAAELSALSQGSVLQATLAGSAVARGLRRFAQWGTLPFQLAERMNRSVTFRATYDLAIRDNTNAWIDEVMLANKPEADQLRIDRGWDERHLRAYMAAADAVRKSQFEYGRWSRPKLMEGPRGVLLMFKTYLQNMLYFMFKAERGTQVRFALTLLFVAGLMGMPGAEDAAELAKWLAKALGVRFDFEHTVRELMVGWGKGDFADIVLHGASREGFGIPAALSGLGIPSPNVDLSGSLSMGRIIPGLQPLINPGSSMANDAIGEIVSEIAGPVFGVPFDMYQAIIDHSLPAQDPKRWEGALPRALKAVSKASRYLAEERERDRTGSTIVKWDPNDLNDQLDILLGVGLGFQPTKLRQTWDYLRAQREVQDYWKGQRQVLMSELYRAHRLKDREGKRDALEAIKRFNNEAPDRALKITGEALRQSLQARVRARRMKEQGIPREKYLRGVTREVQSLYPEVHRRTVPVK